ncbi:low temperature requirement protein A [Microbulbifer hainanensis]|uniref:low temperature requirement protein A n=1 Tax=Microbulbifer hainanensis TaxID=2735675 RepID=UPI00186965C2|nr:low temperature requirement protein A [Microbulbifer hainanensis]
MHLVKGPRSLVEHRQATWLELFFDLIFVACIGVIAHGLSHSHNGHVALKQLWDFMLQFFPLWWIWASHTLYSNRLDTYHRVQRILTLLIIFLLINLSAMFGGNVLVNTSQFILVYSAIRLIIASLYAWSLVGGCSMQRYAGGMCIATLIGAIVSCCALAFSDGVRFVIFYSGIVLEMLLVAFVSRNVRLTREDRKHLVERIGLMSMILLGETIISLVASLQDRASESQNIIAMVFGFILIGAIWWIYYGTFYLLESAKDIRRGITLLYTHVIFAMGLVILASLIGLTMRDEIDLESFRMLALFGVTFFYVGKQISYFKALPPHRINNIVLTLLCVFITACSSYLPNPTLALIGVTFAMLTYVCLHYIWTLPKDVSAYLE